MLPNTDELILEPELHDHKESINFADQIELLSGMGMGFYVINRDPENTFQFNSTITRKGYSNGAAIIQPLLLSMLVYYLL